MLAGLSLGLAHSLALLTGQAGAGERATPRWTFDIQEEAAAMPDRVVVEFDGSGTRPQAASLVVPEPAGRALATLDENILPLFAPRSFGVEERVTASRSADGLSISCVAGDRPAGVVLSSEGVYLPRRMSGSLAIQGRGSAGLVAAVMQPGMDVPDDATKLRSGRSSLTLGDLAFDRTDQVVVILCPNTAAQFSITDMRVQARRSTARKPVGTWLWRPDQWKAAQAVVRLTREEQVRELALQMPVQAGEVPEADAVSAAIASLRKGGQTIIAVEGDPEMVSPQGRRDAAVRIRALRSFNGDVPAGSRIERLELDIEPYSLPAYRLDPAGTWRSWADTVRDLAGAWGDKVLVDVPFWMLGAPGGLDALESARPSLSSVVVMAYRTNPAELPAIVEPWLAWGAARGIDVRIALENGTIAPEVHRTFQKAESGTVTLTQQDGRVQVTLHPTPVRARPGAPVYRLSHETRVDPARISFMDDRAKRGRAVAAILPFLQSWTSFAGLRIHGLWDNAGLDDAASSDGASS